MKRFYKFIFFPFLLLFLSERGLSQDTLRLTLQSAQEIAVAQSIDVQYTRMDAEILRFEANEVMTEGFPKINANIDYNWNFQQQVNVIPENSFFPGSPSSEAIFTQPHAATAKAELNQLVFDARYLYGLKARKSILNMADARENLSEKTIKDGFAPAYLRCLYIREFIEQMEASRALLQNGLELNQKLYDEGLGEALTLDRLRLSIDQINTQIDYAEVNLVNAMANLRYVMNIQPDAVLYLEDSIQHYAEETLDYLGSYQYINLPEYRVLEINDQLRYYDIAQARAQRYPSIYLFGYYGVLAQRSSFSFFKAGPDYRWFDFGTLGFTVNIPIYDGSTAKMQIQQRELKRSQNQLDIERLQKGFAIGLETTANEIENAQNQLDQSIENHALTEKIYRRENILYAEGVGSSFALISAQQDMIEAEIDILEKTYQLAIAKFNWKQKRGIL
ncbi:MAG: TolC family protein [Chitinophagales bacterium]